MSALVEPLAIDVAGEDQELEARVDLELEAWARRLRFTCAVCGCKAIRGERCTRCGARKADMPIPLVPVEQMDGCEAIAVDFPRVDWSRVELDPRLESPDDDDEAEGGTW